MRIGLLKSQLNFLVIKNSNGIIQIHYLCLGPSKSVVRENGHFILFALESFDLQICKMNAAKILRIPVNICENVYFLLCSCVSCIKKIDYNNKKNSETATVDNHLKTVCFGDVCLYLFTFIRFVRCTVRRKLSYDSVLFTHTLTRALVCFIVLHAHTVPYSTYTRASFKSMTSLHKSNINFAHSVKS